MLVPLMVLCKVGLGQLSELQDDNTWLNRPWKEGEAVIEVEGVNTRTFFCSSSVGLRVRCIDG